MSPLLFKLKKWLLIFRYDFRNLPQRLRQSVAYRRRCKESVDSINLKRGIYFYKTPDGTWGLSKDEMPPVSSARKIFLDLKQLTLSEVGADSWEAK
jgi:hypothetical protein